MSRVARIPSALPFLDGRTFDLQDVSVIGWDETIRPGDVLAECLLRIEAVRHDRLS